MKVIPITDEELTMLSLKYGTTIHKVTQIEETTNSSLYLRVKSDDYARGYYSEWTIDECTTIYRGDKSYYLLSFSLVFNRTMIYKYTPKPEKRCCLDKYVM